MKQYEYLRELRENLEGHMTSDEINDILSDYESFFISGKEEGKTEDEISEELGSPAFLAKSLIEEHRRSYGLRNEENFREDFPESGETTNKDKRSGATDKITPHKDKKTAMPGRRMCAYLIDAVIAILPVSVVSFIAGAALLPYLLFISYPAPVAGTLISMSYQVYSTYSVYPTYTYRVTTESRNISDNISRQEVDSTIISEEVYRNGLEDRQSNIKYVTPVKARIISITAIIGIVFYLFYSFACTLIFRGQTVGKKIMGIRVQASNTGTITGTAVFCREFLGKTLINSIPLVAFISFLTILITPEHKALHDMLADTIVVGIER